MTRVNSFSEILQFEKQLVARPWGGSRLGDATAEGPIGEAWLISDLDARPTPIRGGTYAGATLREVMADAGEALLGSVAKPTASGAFPLMLKTLDVDAWLSVQVHPKTGPEAKSELWHVLDARTDAELLCDFSEPPTDEISGGADLPKALQRYAPVAGDSFYVPAGTVHAIGPGLLLAELQQTSDTTYRFYDWDREPARELHAQAARAAIYSDGRAGRIEVSSGDRNFDPILSTKEFAAERMTINGDVLMQTRRTSFHIVLSLAGALRVATEGAEVLVEAGDGVVVPAAAKAYSISGKDGAAFVGYVPDLTLI